MTNAIPKQKLSKLRVLENSLRAATARADCVAALEVLGKIQDLFGADRRHHRLLKNKLWAFESCLDNNDLTFAESGLIGVMQLSGTKTRIYVESASLLAVCYLRLKKPEKAKPLIRTVIARINNIKSAVRRQQFQRRFIERIEEECILSELIGRSDGEMDIQAIHDNAVKLLKENNEDQLMEFIGGLIPPAGVKLLTDVRDYSILQLPTPDRKLLPGAKDAEKPLHLGRRASAVLKRIGWRSLCDPTSTIYKLWSEKVDKVYNETYFTVALTSTFTDKWKIGLPLLITGVVAVVMKYSAKEFCDWSKPEGLMIGVEEKHIEKSA